jgi:hypothetical protein
LNSSNGHYLTRKGLTRSNACREYGYLGSQAFDLAYPILILSSIQQKGYLSECFLRSYGLCLLCDICGLLCPSTKHDLTVLISPRVFFRSDGPYLLQDFGLRVMLLVLNPFLPKWSVLNFDHYYDPTIIMYHPDPMVLIYFGTSGLRSSSFLILFFH